MRIEISMNQYVNYISCAKDNSGTEIVIKARQNYPTFDANGKIISTDQEDVASLVMTTNVARAFLAALSDILDKVDNEQAQSSPSHPF